MATFNNPFEGGGVSYLPLAKIDGVRGVLLCSAVTRGQPRQWGTVPIGTDVVPDFGVIYHGGISFSPTVSERIVLHGMPSPEIPEDGRKWQDVIKFPMLIEDRGLFMASFPNKIARNRFLSLFQMFGYYPEAQQGLLQQYILCPFDPVSTDYGTFQAPVLQPDGWVERDVSVFGPRLIPPPPPFVAGPAVPPKLSNGGGAAAPLAANDAAAPANDPLARFRPAGTVALVQDKRGETVAIHRTWISPDLNPQRKSLGPVAGASVWLDYNGTQKAAIVGEGIETVLAVAELYPLPKVALFAALSWSGLQAFQVPDSVEVVHIAADYDPVGLKAARALQRRLRTEGREVDIWCPPTLGTDFNDVLRLLK